METMLIVPSRRSFVECLPFFDPFPFGRTSSYNFLEGFRGSNEGGSELKVLFLGCGDLKNPLTALASRAPGAGNIEIHINDNSLPVIARNILILKAISSKDFNLESQADMDYIWDLWYNATWPQSTFERFTQDIKSLLEEPLPENLIIPRRKQLKELKSLWTKWLSMARTSYVKDVLAQRSASTAKSWETLFGHSDENDRSLPKDPLAHAVIGAAVERVESSLFSDIDSFIHNRLSDSTESRETLLLQIRQYFATGHCAGRRETHANPTLLNPANGNWFVRYTACPFEGYFPLPSEELDAIANGKDGILRHCKKELTKLVESLRKRMDQVKFVFHPCDALAFCYEDSPDGFDLIDTSNLADHVGLINLLIAASRKLRSDESVLFTELLLTTDEAYKSLPRFLKKLLCCPESLNPTLYGLRLMDTIEFGPETIDSVVWVTGMGTRLRWVKTQRFEGVPIVSSDTLEKALDQLRTRSFFTSCDDVENGLAGYTPLSFRYILSDLIRRGRSKDLMESAASLSKIPRHFHQAMKTSQAWMEGRPVWRVKIRIDFESEEQKWYDVYLRNGSCTLVPLRLILANSSRSLYDSKLERMFESPEADCQFIDNLNLDVRMKPSGDGIDHVDIIFLLEDRSLLKTRTGFLIDLTSSCPNCFFVFGIGPLSNRPLQVDRFNRPFPSPLDAQQLTTTSSLDPGMEGEDPRLVAVGCQESKRDYVIRLVVPSGGTDETLSGLKVTGEEGQKEPWLCDSSHRITFSLDGMEPVTITLPFPVCPEQAKPTLDLENGIMEVLLPKGEYQPWPEDVGCDGPFCWDAEALEPWNDPGLLTAHLNSQFPSDYMKNPWSPKWEDSFQINEIIRSIFIRATRNENDVHFRLKSKDSSDSIYLRAHPPVLTSPHGAPILLLSAMDCCGSNRLRKSRDGAAEDSSSSSQKWITFYPESINGREHFGFFPSFLRLNAVRIRPAPWQKENLPEGEGPHPWLATFIRPLYLGNRRLNVSSFPTSSSSSVASCANKCRTTRPGLKWCARCKSVPYCSAECQRTHWKFHKAHCFKV